MSDDPKDDLKRRLIHGLGRNSAFSEMTVFVKAWCARGGDPAELLEFLREAQRESRAELELLSAERKDLQDGEA